VVLKLLRLLGVGLVAEGLLLLLLGRLEGPVMSVWGWGWEGPAG